MRQLIKKLFSLSALCMALLLLPATTAPAQSPLIDSLKARLTAHPQTDTGRVNRLNTLSKAVQNSNPALAQRLAQEALALAQRIDYVAGQARAYLTLGLCSVTHNDLSRAIAFTQNARRLYVRLGNQREQITCFTQLSAINIGVGNYPLALAYGLQALSLADRLHDQAKKAAINYMISQTYALLGDYNKAWSYARTGLQLSQSENNPSRISQGMGTLGEISRMQGKWQVARHYYQQSLIADQQQKDPFNEAITEGNIADVSEHEGHYTESLRYGGKVLAYFRSIHADGYLPWIQSVMARAYLHTGQLDSAIVYGLRSQVGAQRGKQPIYRRDAAQVLAQAYARRGDFARAYRQQTQYMTLKDSLTGEETIRQTTAMQYTYALDKQQLQIALLTKNQKIEQERARYERGLLYASAAVGLLLLTLAIVLIRNNRAKQRTNAELYRQKQIIETSLTAEIVQQGQQLLESQLKVQQEALRAVQSQLRLQQEKERISRDLHDNVGAQLSIIASSLDHVRMTQPFNGSATRLEDIGTYAREAIGSLRETIWAINREQITLDEYRLQLQQYLHRQQTLIPTSCFRLQANLPGSPSNRPAPVVWLSSEQALGLFRIAQEAVQNAVKHARASQITVCINTHADHELHLSVADDGVGFDPATEHPGHYGMLNMRLRAERLGGQWSVTSAPGRGTTLSLALILRNTEVCV